MAWIAAAAAVVGAAIGGAASNKAANKQAKATEEAAAAQKKTATTQLEENQRQYDIAREDFTPWRDAGQKALGQLATENDRPLSAADVMNDPGYQFGLDQGQIVLDRKAAASGGRVSGAALKAASEYGANYATAGYGAAYQRRQDRLNRLASLAGIGQTATGASAAAGASMTGQNSAIRGNSTNAIIGLVERQGDAGAATTLAQGNIWGNAVNQLGALYGRNNTSSSPGDTANGTSGAEDFSRGRNSENYG